jgi:hypothetical protein
LSRILHEQREYSPGPGSYDNQKSKQIGGNNSRKVTMGSKQKSSPNNDSPGPGAYDRKDGFESPHKQGYTSLMSKDSRMKYNQNEKSNVPGPGQYDPKDFLTRDRSHNA